MLNKTVWISIQKYGCPTLSLETWRKYSNSNFIIPKYSNSNDVNLLYFKLRIFNLTEYVA